MPSKHILLVEDGLVNQYYTHEILQQMGHKTHIASNGLEAVNALEQNAFDLVLMDCRMPIMDGFTATKIIRNTPYNNNANIPIIALTANVMDDDESACLNAGMNDYLTKPFTEQQLRQKINHWLAVQQNTPPLLDLTTAAQMHDLMSDSYDQMLDNFEEDVTNAIHNMQSANATGTIRDYILPAHTIKSTARLMGAFKLADIAQDIEKTALANADKQLPPFTLRHRLWHLIGTFKRTKTELNAFHNSQKPAYIPPQSTSDSLPLL